jgi:hypothetical protein
MRRDLQLAHPARDLRWDFLVIFDGLDVTLPLRSCGEDSREVWRDTSLEVGVGSVSGESCCMSMLPLEMLRGDNAYSEREARIKRDNDRVG